MLNCYTLFTYFYFTYFILNFLKIVFVKILRSLWLWLVIGRPDPPGQLYAPESPSSSSLSSSSSSTTLQYLDRQSLRMRHLLLLSPVGLHLSVTLRLAYAFVYVSHHKAPSTPATLSKQHCHSNRQTTV